MELRWDGVASLAEGLRLLREQAARTPPPQWVRVVGGWSEFQFAERRMPTLAELNAAAPDTPVFVLHLYDRAMLNAAALRAVGYTADTPSPARGEIEKDYAGNPTGLLIAQPDAALLYATLAKGPVLDHDDQVNSTLQFMRELNRLGLTSVTDAGGGFQSYPDDYRVIEELHAQGRLTLRFGYHLFSQHPGAVIPDLRKWTGELTAGAGDDFYRLVGVGEMLIYTAYDFEDFRQPRPDIGDDVEPALEQAVRLLVSNRFPFRMHATYDESIARYLAVFERVHRDTPMDGLGWFFDHAETVSPDSLERIARLGGGIAIQDRMALQGEVFRNRYGADPAGAAPPVSAMLAAGLPVGMGTDATRVSSYNPWLGLSWLTTGRTAGGTVIRPPDQRLSREDALRLYTVGSAWFSGDTGRKGAIAPGQLADLAVLSQDYLTVPDEDLPQIQSVLTVVDGRVVHGADGFADLAPPLPPASPDWSPARNR